MDRPRVLALGLAISLYPALGCATPPRTPAEEPAPLTQSRAAQAQSDVRARVESLLDRAAPAQDWKPLGPDALRVLEQLFNDPATQPERRARALAAMGLLDVPEAPARLAAIVQDKHLDPPSRAQAAAVLARRGGDAVAPALKAALSDPAPKVREAVARALSGVATDQTRLVLEERLSEEEDAAVREAIQQALTKQQP